MKKLGQKGFGTIEVIFMFIVLSVMVFFLWKIFIFQKEFKEYQVELIEYKLLTIQKVRELGDMSYQDIKQLHGNRIALNDTKFDYEIIKYNIDENSTDSSLHYIDLYLCLYRRDGTAPVINIQLKKMGNGQLIQVPSGTGTRQTSYIPTVPIVVPIIKGGR